MLFLKCKRHENLIISEVVRTMFMYNLLPLSSSNGTTNSISLNNMLLLCPVKAVCGFK